MYISTRNISYVTSSSNAIVNGLAADNGLYSPINIPKIKNSLKYLSTLSYKELASNILSYYLDDFTNDEIIRCVDNSYTSKFENDQIVRLSKINNMYFLELYHGPTLAFKDIAITLFPNLLKESLKKINIEKELIILVATSGDTGKATLEAFKDIDGITVIVFYPKYGVSSLQEIQMLTQEGNNTYVIGLNGNFDNAQKGVKDILDNISFKDTLKNYHFTSANSINIGRFLPQIIYYFYSYCELLKNNEISYNSKVNFVVPTGNFGNILAGYFAKEMGLPINKLICASNENNVLTDFINTGIYNRNREFKATSSPSMDILVSSNVERLLFELSNKDSNLIIKLMNDLSNNGCYEVPEYMKEKLKTNFYGEYTTDSETLDTINNIYKKYNYLIDPHTAVAYYSYEKYKLKINDSTPTIILSTASPYKFPEVINRALNISDLKLNTFDLIKKISASTHTDIPNSIIELSSKSKVHFINCSENHMKDVITNILAGGDNLDDKN